MPRQGVYEQYMKPWFSVRTVFVVVLCLFALKEYMLGGDTLTNDSVEIETWSVQKGREWLRNVGWLVGANFVPSTAINQIEMFQDVTWDPKRINTELTWASQSGMNCMRVFLHNLLWEENPKKFLKRVDEYLAISQVHGIKTIIVLFDACWRGDARLGVQPSPLPHVHNSGWLQCPNYVQLQDRKQWDQLQQYVESIITHFKDDERIAMWDIYNEPNNNELDFRLVKERFSDLYPPFTPDEKNEYVFQLLKKAFRWAHTIRPSQPITSALWGSMSPEDTDRSTWNGKFTELMLRHSDIITFHNYDPPTEDFKRLLRAYKRLKKPVVCTEYMQRTGNSTVKMNLPLMADLGIGAINWGLVDGKTQTVYPWDSWVHSFSHKPHKWHHDLFRKDGSPFDGEELDLIERYSQSVRV